MVSTGGSRPERGSRQGRSSLGARRVTDPGPTAPARPRGPYESGDLARVQALYTDDGIWAPTGKMFGLDHGDDSHFGTLGVDGSELRRTATLHAGELDIFRAVQVGDRAVAFGWRWSDFASGTGVLHLRDGKIAVASLAVTEAEISLAP